MWIYPEIHSLEKEELGLGFPQLSLLQKGSKEMLKATSRSCKGGGESSLQILFINYRICALNLSSTDLKCTMENLTGLKVKQPEEKYCIERLRNPPVQIHILQIRLQKRQMKIRLAKRESVNIQKCLSALWDSSVGTNSVFRLCCMI